MWALSWAQAHGEGRYCRLKALGLGRICVGSNKGRPWSSLVIAGTAVGIKARGLTMGHNGVIVSEGTSR